MKKGLLIVLALILVTTLVGALVLPISASEKVTIEVIKDLDAETLSFEPELKLTRNALSGWVGYKLVSADVGDPADVLTLGLGIVPFSAEYVKPLSEDSDGTIELKVKVKSWEFKYKRTLNDDKEGKVTVKLTLGF